MDCRSGAFGLQEPSAAVTESNAPTGGRFPGAKGRTSR
jgi:hypothetical protein